MEHGRRAWLDSQRLKWWVEITQAFLSTLPPAMWKDKQRLWNIEQIGKHHIWMWSGSTAMCLNIWFSTRGAVLGCCGSDLDEFLRKRPCGICFAQILWDLRTPRSSLRPPWHDVLPWAQMNPTSFKLLLPEFCKSRTAGSTRAKWQWATGAWRKWWDIRSWEASRSFSGPCTH